MTNEYERLDATRLRECLQQGLNRLMRQRDHLNHINVFPIPDGDTGNNLAQTAMAARAAIDEWDGNHTGELLRVLAEGALDGAQGNSGAILAQFFHGLATALEPHEELEGGPFAEALSSAAAYTREALDQPTEGTILSVIDAVAEAAQNQRRNRDFDTLLPALVEVARKAVTATTDQLPALSRAGVVDAGALGFSCFLEGLTENLLEGIVDSVPLEDTEADLNAIAHAHHAEDLEYRYCTECMLSGTGLDAALVRQNLQALGNSLVIAGSPARLRIHIHTNEPESIFELASEFGEVSNTKADDMLGQARSLNRASRDVAIVTDSAADISDEVMAAHGIHMVPLRIQIGARSHLDKSGMSPAELRLEMQRNGSAPSTSQPTQGDFRRMYDFLAAHFSEIVSIHLSATLSGTWQGAGAAAERSVAADRIRILDCRSVSVGQGLVTVRAAELAEEGVRGGELVRAIEDTAAEVRSFALVADLGNAVKSGRVRPFIKHVADWLGVVPILRTDTEGSIALGGVLLSRRRLVERFARRVVDKLDRNREWRYAIAHGYSEHAEAEQLNQALQALLPGSKCAWQTEIGSALGIHAGMEALVVAFCPLSTPPD